MSTSLPLHADDRGTIYKQCNIAQKLEITMPNVQNRQIPNAKTASKKSFINKQVQA